MLNAIYTTKNRAVHVQLVHVHKKVPTHTANFSNPTVKVLISKKIHRVVMKMRDTIPPAAKETSLIKSADISNG